MGVIDKIRAKQDEICLRGYEDEETKLKRQLATEKAIADKREAVSKLRAQIDKEKRRGQQKAPRTAKKGSKSALDGFLGLEAPRKGKARKKGKKSLFEADLGFDL